MNKEYETMKSEALLSIKKSKKLQPMKIDTLLSMDFPAGKWIVDKLIPHACITILSGAPASFKTWLLLRMAIDIANGDNFLDHFFCQQCSILIIDEENPAYLLQERLQSMNAQHDIPIYFLSQKDFLVSNQAMVEEILAICEEKDISVIFIDSLVRVNTADENDSSQMSRVFKSLRQFCRKDITIIITHHERKDGETKASAQNRLRGSSDISASVDAHISVRRDRNSKSKVTIEQAKLRGDIEMKPFEVSIEKIENKTIFQYLGEPPKKTNKSDSAKEAILNILANEPLGLAKNKIRIRVEALINIGEKNINKSIKTLIQEGVISEKKGAKNTNICYLSKNTATE